MRWENSAGLILYLRRRYICCPLSTPLTFFLNWYTVLPIRREPPQPPFFSNSLWIFLSDRPSTRFYIQAPVSPCCWRPSIRRDIKSESLWSQLLEKGLVGVAGLHQLGNIAFTHRAVGSGHNEESAEGDIFHFYYQGLGTFTITTCPPFFFCVSFILHLDGLKLTFFCTLAGMFFLLLLLFFVLTSLTTWLTEPKHCLQILSVLLPPVLPAN